MSGVMKIAFSHKPPGARGYACRANWPLLELTPRLSGVLNPTPE